MSGKKKKNMNVRIQSKISRTERNSINNNYCRSSMWKYEFGPLMVGGFVNTDGRMFPTKNGRTCIVFHFLFYYYAEKIAKTK